MNQLPEPELKNGILQFALKAAILVMLIVIALSYLIQDIESAASSMKPTEKSRILLLGLVQNPAALYQASAIEEKEGNVERAIADMELAMGLLEMHGAQQQVVARYSDRMRELKSKKQLLDKPSK